MASLILNPVFQVLVDGVPLAGGLVYTRECGTHTSKTTYTDYAQTTENTQPVVLDSNGTANIYCSGCLRVFINDSNDVQVDEIDDIMSFDSTLIQDADRDTKIQVEESADEDVIRFDVAGTQQAYIDSTGWHGNVIFDQAKGDLRRATFSWKDADEIYIDAGAYDHNGTTQQFVYWTSQLTFQSGPSGSNSDNATLGASTWYYLYLDDSAIVTQDSPLLDEDCFLLSATAPTWDGTRHGYYANTYDRCIFALRSTAASGIEEFFHYADQVLFLEYDQIEDATNVGTTFQDVTALSMPSFSTKAPVTFVCTYVDGTAALISWRPNGASSGVGFIGGVSYSDVAYINTDVITDSSFIIEWKESSSTAGTYSLWQNGWYLPNGM